MSHGIRFSAAEIINLDQLESGTKNATELQEIAAQKEFKFHLASISYKPICRSIIQIHDVPVEVPILDIPFFCHFENHHLVGRVAPFL
jgi:hypothetical protein